jgi:hypothetical protein
MFWFEGWRLIVGKKGASSIVNKGSIKKIQNSEVRIQESEEMRIAEWGNYTIIVIFNIC